MPGPEAQGDIGHSARAERLYEERRFPAVLHELLSDGGVKKPLPVLFPGEDSVERLCNLLQAGSFTPAQSSEVLHQVYQFLLAHRSLQVIKHERLLHFLYRSYLRHIVGVGEAAVHAEFHLIFGFAQNVTRHLAG